MNGSPDSHEAFAAFLLRLRGKGIVSRELVAAFEATPRHEFCCGLRLRLGTLELWLL